MKTRLKILNAVRIVGGTILTLGIILFTFGILGSDYNSLTSIGIGTIMGAVFIFLMGIFFVATEEMQEKSTKGISVIPAIRKKGAPL